jgi:S1-C subfamily serine protease
LQVGNASEGVVVLDSDAGSYASNLGFQRGDIIEEVNGSKIEKTRDLEKIAQQGARSWRIVILRRGQRIVAQFN